MKGDWVDTIAHDSTIRFVTDAFAGRIILHCHILEHEDLGMMAVYYADGGCDGNDTQCIRINAECDKESGKSYDNIWNSYWIYVIIGGILLCLIAIICYVFILWKRQKSRNMKKVGLVKNMVVLSQRKEIDFKFNGL